MTKKGFTLIELLVVISIIALLSSVVLGALNVARSRAADTAVKAGLKQVLHLAEQYRDNAPNMGVSAADCVTASTVFMDTQVTAARVNILQNAAAGATMACSTDATGNNWAMSVSALKGGGTLCIDNSQGWFRAGAAATSGVNQGKCQ